MSDRADDSPPGRGKAKLRSRTDEVAGRVEDRRTGSDEGANLT